MTQSPSVHSLETIEQHLVPVLRRQGLVPENIQATGILGGSQWSLVYSLMIDHQYYVLKLYYNHDNFTRELRNMRRLTWPPKIILASPARQNGLGYDFVITQVPQGTSFTSDYLQDWVRERLAAHLVELHRIRRARKVSVAALKRSVNDIEYGATTAAYQRAPEFLPGVQAVIDELKHFVNNNAGLMRVPVSWLHNDLWWDNIIVAKDDVYLIDWEWLTSGDYLEDLAYARVMLEFHPVHKPSRSFWRTAPNQSAADRFFAAILEAHMREFADHTAPERLRFYLALVTLRRLSDYAAGTYGDQPAMRDHWLDHLEKFWRYGFEPAAPNAVAPPTELI